MATPSQFARALKRAVIDVQDLGQVHLRCPSARTATQLAEIEASKTEDTKAARDMQMLEVLLRASVCDEKGELLFPDGTDPLEAMTVEQAGAIAAKASELMAGGKAGAPPNAPGGPSAA